MDPSKRSKPNVSLNSVIEHCWIEKLPHEILLNIFSYLDLKSLCRAACVNRSFKTLAYDPSLYTIVDISRHPRTNFDREKLKLQSRCSRALASLASRCKRLRKLNISYAHEIEPQFDEFMRVSGCRLTHLYATKAKIKLPEDCSELVELWFRRSMADTGAVHVDFTPLTQCHHLEVLNIFANFVKTEQIVQILRQNRSLKHFDIGACSPYNGDSITKALAEHNVSLETLNLRNVDNITPEGINNIAKLTNLQILNLDSARIDCRMEDTNCLLKVLTHCTQLTKLYLYEWYQFSKEEIVAMTEHCPLIEYLNLNECQGIDNELASMIVSRLKNLEYINLDRCSIDADDIVKLRQAHRYVHIEWEQEWYDE